MNRKRKQPEDEVDENPASSEQLVNADYRSQWCAGNTNLPDKVYLSQQDKKEDIPWPPAPDRCANNVIWRFGVWVKDYYTVKTAIASVFSESSTGVMKVLMSYIPIYSVIAGNGYVTHYSAPACLFEYVGYDIEMARAAFNRHVPMRAHKDRGDFADYHSYHDKNGTLDTHARAGCVEIIDH
jgi:hypothetical protein